MRRFVVDNAADVAARLPRRRAAARRRARPARQPGDTLLEELSARSSALAAALGRPLWLIAESDRNDPRTVTPRAAGGIGLDAQWADDVHHGLHVVLTGESHGYYADFAAAGTLEKVLTRRVPARRDLVELPRPHHGRPVDRHHRRMAVRVIAADPDQVGNRAQVIGCQPGWIRGCWPAGLRCSSPRPTPRCSSWVRNGGRRRTGSSSPTTPTRRSPRRSPPGATRSSPITDGAAPTCPLRRTCRPSSGRTWTGRRRRSSNTCDCCTGTRR